MNGENIVEQKKILMDGENLHQRRKFTSTEKIYINGEDVDGRRRYLRTEKMSNMEEEVPTKTKLVIHFFVDCKID